MTLPYTTYPKNYFELVDAVRGQLERARELSLMGETMNRDEKVVITPEAFMGMLDKIEEMREVINNQMAMFVMVQQILLYVFEALGLPVEDFFETEDEYEGD